MQQTGLSTAAISLLTIVGEGILGYCLIRWPTAYVWLIITLMIIIAIMLLVSLYLISQSRNKDRAKAIAELQKAIADLQLEADKDVDELTNVITRILAKAVVHSDRSLFPMEQILKIESSAKTVDIFAPTLRPDLQDFIHVILRNISNKIPYRYIFPESERDDFKLLTKYCQENMANCAELGILQGKSVRWKLAEVQLLILGCDRPEGSVAYLYLPLHPGAEKNLFELSDSETVDVKVRFNGLWQSLDKLEKLRQNNRGKKQKK